MVESSITNVDPRLNVYSEEVKGIFHFLSIDELYSMPRSTDWLVKPYLDNGSLAMLFGKSGTLKSFAVIDMGLSIATGTDWHGNPVGQGTVFYICGEGQKGIARRLRAWEISHKKNLKEEKVPFFVSNCAAQFLDNASAREVVTAVNNMCEHYGKPVLIIIDTLNRNFGPGDESSTADMTDFVTVVDRELRHQFDCTVNIVHHTGLKEQDRARGAYALHAAIDWEYKAVKHGIILELTNLKAKDYEPPPAVYLRSEIVTLDWKEEDGSPMTSLVLTSTTETVKRDGPLTGANKIAYEALVEGIRQNGGTPILTETWRLAAYEAKISTSAQSSSKSKAFNRAKENLQQMGLIQANKDYWRLIPDM
jgi:hypothetical protein